MKSATRNLKEENTKEYKIAYTVTAEPLDRITAKESGYANSPYNSAPEDSMDGYAVDNKRLGYTQWFDKETFESDLLNNNSSMKALKVLVEKGEATIDSLNQEIADNKAMICKNCHHWNDEMYCNIIHADITPVFGCNRFHTENYVQHKI